MSGEITMSASADASLVLLGMIADRGPNNLSSRRGVECNITQGGCLCYCTFITGHGIIACVAGSSSQAAIRLFNTSLGTLANRSHTLALELGSGSNLGLIITYPVTDNKETGLPSGDGGFWGQGGDR